MRELYNIKIEKLKKHLIKKSEKGIVYITSNDFLDILNIKGNNSYYINDLIEQGFLIKLHDGWRKGSDWFPAKYQINPQYKRKRRLADQNLFYERFNSTDILFLTENQQTWICVSSIPNAVEMHSGSIYRVLRKNPELFHCLPYQRMLFINKEEFLVLLMKLNYPSLNKKRRKQLLTFQKWAMNIYEEKHHRLQYQAGLLLKENQQIKKQYIQLKNHIVDFNNLVSNY